MCLHLITVVPLVGRPTATKGRHGHLKKLSSFIFGRQQLKSNAEVFQTSMPAPGCQPLAVIGEHSKGNSKNKKIYGQRKP